MPMYPSAHRKPPSHVLHPTLPMSSTATMTTAVAAAFVASVAPCSASTPRYGVAVEVTGRGAVGAKDLQQHPSPHLSQQQQQLRQPLKSATPKSIINCISSSGSCSNISPSVVVSTVSRPSQNSSPPLAAVPGCSARQQASTPGKSWRGPCDG